MRSAGVGAGEERGEVTGGFGLGGGEPGREENMQYIATLNTGDLAKATRLGVDAEPYTLETVLTDSPTGGLVGFRY